MARSVTLLLVFAMALAACATRVDSQGRRYTDVNPRYLAKSDVDRVVDADRNEVIAGLHRVAARLYRRNPREWQKGGSATAEAALKRLFSGATNFPELEGRREGDAALYAFSANYAGDRVLALMAGLLGMVYAAFENKTDFYLLDDLNEQKLYNCARNVEIALAKLSSAKGLGNEPLLLSNDLDVNRPNLSIEREFGRVIGLLDFLSLVVSDKNGRAITRVTQSVATAIFLPVGALGFK
jgi:hypothetical protein